MENVKFSVSTTLFIFLMVLQLPQATLGKPREQIVQLKCVKEKPRNLTYFVSNLVAATETASRDIQIQPYGAETSGGGHDAAYSLIQCYGDLSLTDCVICYIKARTYVSQCVPYSGGKTFLDGCFLRINNYNFFREYTGPDDNAVCGNRTSKNLAFRRTARQAVLQAASYAPKNNGYARAQMPVPDTRNESVYVLAQCWGTLNADSCKACLENASTLIFGCLPWSEGRALNTGCFLRYSETNFLNPIPSNGSSSGRPISLIAAIVSSTVVAAGAAISVAYIWKHKRIQKKRKGSYDAKNLAKILLDGSLNFKYSILEKATSGFDEANKLGQGGYGVVYRVER